MKFSDLFTDSLGRMEIKNVLGAIGFLGSFAYLFIYQDVTGFGAASLASTALFVTNTVADSKIDNQNKQEIK